MHHHATVSLWQRAEDGHYEAELNGWKLDVRWTSDTPGRRGGFDWEATGSPAAKASSAYRSEEIELAMAEAEAHAAKASPVVSEKT